MIELFAPIAQGLGQGLAGGIGGAMSPAPAGPSLSSATQSAYGNGMGNTGWAVNFKGQQNASSSPSEGGAGSFLSGSFMGLPIWAIAAVGGFILWKKSKK